jgi:hypothetical protein
MGSAYINTYDARPMLHIRQERNRRYTSYSYVSAVRRETTPPSFEELKHAYHVAGDSFIGRLKEIFLILDDDAAKKPSNAGGKSKASKNAKAGKRRASGDSSNEVKKKVPATQ